MTKLEKARKFLNCIKKLSKKYDLDFFCVTEGASVYSMKSVDKNSAIYNARQSQIKWEKENGFDPNEDWETKQNKTVKQICEDLFGK